MKEIFESDRNGDENYSFLLQQSIERGTQNTDRDLEKYSRAFHLEPKDLSGKKILDIGSGSQGTFARQANKLHAEVFSLSPNLINWPQRKQEKGLLSYIIRDNYWRERSVAARSQQIPFKENQFDMVTSLFSVPNYLSEHAQIFSSIQEMTRVLKPGGECYIGPIFYLGSHNLKYDKLLRAKMGDETVDWLKVNGYSIDFIGEDRAGEYYKITKPVKPCTPAMHEG